MTMNCDVKGMATEKNHTPGCQHQTECVDCGRWLLKHRTRFPLGSKKRKTCVYCFKSKWQTITEMLVIDWQVTDKEV